MDVDKGTESKWQEFCKDNVVVRDIKDLEGKFKSFMEDGPERLQVLADFDGTFTNYHEPSFDGKKDFDSGRILTRTKTLSQAYRDGVNALETWVKPIFVSREISTGEKEKALNRVYSEWDILISKERVKVDDIQKAAEDSNTPLKEGCSGMFSLLSDLGVPLTVVSAGMGDVIAHMLRDFKPTVVANFLRFDESGGLLGFKTPIITPYNKHTIPLSVDKGRHNIVLLGDALEDCRVGESIEDIKALLKIGFFVGNDESRLQKYLSCYDIVLVDDPTMDTVTATLKMIAGV